MDLNGHEYRFCESTYSKSITVQKLTFGMRVTHHPVLGRKLLPTVGTNWSVIATYNNHSLEEAIAAFVAGGCQSVKAVPKESPKVTPLPIPSAAEIPKITPAKHNQEMKKSPTSRPDIGDLIFLGEKQFPDRQNPGGNYTCFAIVLQTSDGEKILQGEGLRDEIAATQVKIGQRIQVERLGKVPVELVDKKTQTPKLDSAGAPVMGSKWQWKITALT